METENVRVLLKEDAQLLSDAKKEAYINENVLNQLNIIFNLIRETANKASYVIRYTPPYLMFGEEIFDKVVDFIKKAGYEIIRDYKNKKTNNLVIQWHKK